MGKKQERHQLILHEVNVYNRVLLTDLAHRLQVSVDTVRRDVQELDAEQRLQKVHGGAVSLGYQGGGSAVSGQVYALESKREIVRKTLPLLKSNSVVLISGGTTNLELVRSLPEHLQGTFFTPSLPVAAALLAHPKIEVIFIGGQLSKASQVAVGGSALNALSEIQVDVCFLGTGCFDTQNGLTEVDWEVAQMKKAMIRAARKVVLLTISEKLNTRQRYKICDAQQIQTLITELPPTHDLLTPYQQAQLHVL